MRKVVIVSALFVGVLHGGLSPTKAQRLFVKKFSATQANIDTLTAKSTLSLNLRTKSISSNVIRGTFLQNSVRRVPMITFRFDDGYKDNLDAAALLANYGAKGVEGVIVNAVIRADSVGNRMDWNDLRTLHDVYGWEIASHSYNHDYSSFDDWDFVYLQLVGSKRMLEDSIGSVVTTYIAPGGIYNDKVDYLLRQEYDASLAWSSSSGKYYDRYVPVSPDPYRLPFKLFPDTTHLELIDSLVKDIADSSRWAIFFSHEATPWLEVIESLAVCAKRYGVAIVTVQEAESLWSFPSDNGIMKTKFYIEPTTSFRAQGKYMFMPATNWLGDNASFEEWENGMPVSWEVVNSGGLRPNVLKDNDVRPSGVITLRDSLGASDSLILSKHFAAPESPYALFSIWRSYMPTVLGDNYWILRDSISDTYWDDTLRQWSTSEIHNTFGHWPSTNKTVERFYTHLYFPDSSVYVLVLHSKNSLTYYPGYDWYFDDVRICPDVDFNVKYVLEFSPSHFSDSKVNCLLDFIWDIDSVGPVLTSPNGTKYRLKVDDSGNLSTEQIIK